MHPTVVRFARPTDRLGEVVTFWRDAVGLAELGGFVDHDGVDGVMLGPPGAAWHLEFTRTRGHHVGDAPTSDHLVVIYLDDEAAFAAAVSRIESHGHRAVPSQNPYWDRRGRTYVDPDGYRVVLQRGTWSPPT